MTFYVYILVFVFQRIDRRKTISTDDLEPINDSQLAKKLGVSRQAISNRRNRGWTEEEIQSGKREGDGTYGNAHYTKVLGRPVKEIAEEEGVSRVAVYRRLKRAGSRRSRSAKQAKGTHVES